MGFRTEETLDGGGGATAATAAAPPPNFAGGLTCRNASGLQNDAYAANSPMRVQRQVLSGDSGHLSDSTAVRILSLP